METGSGHQNLLHLALLSIIIRLQILHRFADCRSKVHLIGVIVDYYYTSARMNRLTPVGVSNMLEIIRPKPASENEEGKEQSKTEDVAENAV